MVDAEYDAFASPSPGILPQGRSASALLLWLHVSAAVVSLGLVAGFAVWGYRLATLEVTGVPVVRALAGPMRVLPDDPGGWVSEFQGLAVNDVAGEGVAADIPDRLTLAPRPIDLAGEDQPGLGAVPGADLAEASIPPGTFDPVALAPDGLADIALAAEPKVESASPTAVAVDAALAEALGGTPGGTAGAGDATAPALAPLTVGEIATSPRPKPRPALLHPGAAADLATPLPAIQEVDPATIPLGTRLVQFGTYNSTDEARLAWVRLADRFGDLMLGKAMVLQTTESNGRTLWRLRAHGFESEADARRFCVAFAEQGESCIPVPQR